MTDRTAPEAVSDDQVRWQLAVGAAGVGSFDWNLLTDELRWDATLMDIWGYAPEQYVPHIDSFYSRVHDEDKPQLAEAIEASRTARGVYRAEYRVVRPDGSLRWVQARGQVSFRDGEPVRMLGVAFDITESRQARALARQTTERLALLNTVSEALSATLDVEEAVARLAHILVPRLAEWCIVSLVDETGRLRDVGHWHADPACAELLARYTAVRLDAADVSRWVRGVVDRGARPATVPFPAYEFIAAAMPTEEGRALVEQLQPFHSVAVPLVVRGQSLGLLSLSNGRGRGPFGGSDLQTAAEVAARASVALDGARTHARIQRIAETLQRSLLTPVPVSADWDIEARYVPAQDTAEVGGDWYDAFALPDGSTVLVIGDVMGHDMAAAAAMGQVRTTLRGIAHTTMSEPAVLLQAVDRALTGLGVAAITTVSVARLYPPDPAGRAAVRWSRAGHPPLVLRDAAGARLEFGDADPPLGVVPTVLRRQQELPLGPGDQLWLYTDGLIERRDRSLETGMELLRESIGSGGPGTLSAACDRVIATLAPDGAHDDVAVLAVALRA